MGTVSVNQHGNLFFYFYWKGRKFREGTGYKDTTANRKKCEARMILVQAEIDAGRFSIEKYLHYFPYGNCAAEFQGKVDAKKQKPVTFSEYAEQWLTEKAPPVLKHTTHQDYESIIRKTINPVLGDTPLINIKETDLLEFRRTLSGLSGQRLNNIFTPLKGVLKAAHRRGVIQVDPTAFIRPLRHEEPDIKPLALDEVRYLADRWTPFWSIWLTVLCYTGMRTGEWSALTWKRVRFDDDIIEVRDTWTRSRLDTPKTKAGRRDITMLPPVRDALLDLAVLYWQEGIESPLVFPNEVGRPLAVNNLSRRFWTPALDAAKVEPRVVYQTRHTFASLMLQAGEDPAWIAKQMGHTSIQVLFDKYARFIQSTTRKDGSAFMKMMHGQ